LAAGFSYPNINRFRQFYARVSLSKHSIDTVNRIRPGNCLDSVDRNISQEKPDAVWRIRGPSCRGAFPSSLSAYVRLLSVTNADGLPNKIFATEYRTVLPDEQLIADEIEKTRHELESRRSISH